MSQLHYNAGRSRKHMHALITLHSPPPALLCPLRKFQGRPVKGQSSIKTIMHPDFLDGFGSTAAARVERIRTLPPVYVFYHFSPALVPFTETLSAALLLLLSASSPPHPYNLVRKRGPQGLRGTENGCEAVLSSFYLIVYDIQCLF